MLSDQPEHLRLIPLR